MIKIGDHVSWKANIVIGAGTGRVTKLYPGYSDRNEDGPYTVEDYAAVLVDKIPTPWPYPDTKTFAPEAARLTKIGE